MRISAAAMLIICAGLLFASCAAEPEIMISSEMPEFSESGDALEYSLPDVSEEAESQAVSEIEPEESNNADASEASQEASAPELEKAEETDAEPVFEIDLTIPREFKITRPESKFTTEYTKYFITGTSDPSMPLYYEDEEIVRQGKSGLFGVLAELDIGTNTFTFVQGGETATVTIIRKPEAKTTPIDKILPESMFPSIQGGVKAGQAIPVRCIAPSGASVFAEFDGVKTTLAQTGEAQDGIPAVFTGEITVGIDYDENRTVKAGPVTYILIYKGAETEYKSRGDMYIAGKNSAIAVEINTYAGFVFPDTSDLSQIKEKLRLGSADYIVWQNNSYFELKSGGYISLEAVKIIEGNVNIEAKLSGILAESDGKGEAYFIGADKFPAYYTRVEDDVFYLTLYNTSGTPKPDTSVSALFSEASVSEETGRVTYAFTLKAPDMLWGYDVTYSGGELKLSFKYRPKLSDKPDRPLEGITVLLDPGHGGTDGGALGLPGKTGPAESAINLATAFAAKNSLEALGANVRLTRTDDSNLSLNARMALIDTNDADIFLSVHHNSVREDADANTISGMEIYYHNALSEAFALDMMESLGDDIDRTARFVRQSYYRVTLMPYCPALLLELGFMSNPLEYEKMADAREIKIMAEAVAKAVERAIDNQIVVAKD